jgi:maltooligosyltrehalose trehalohydrolase
LEAQGGGWYELVTTHAGVGTRYRYAVDEALMVPDPASRFQPGGVHAASEVIDPRAFAWPRTEWKRPPWETAVLYELHVGTFSESGTYAGVIEKLDALMELGVTALEIMPLAAAPGARTWGYDGVAWFAPYAGYGRPEDLKRLVAAAHAKGLAVLLDVVYNHFGPEGNFLHGYAPTFFTERHQTPWGAAIDYERCGEARAFVMHNALYWLEEYGFDGLRLDAVQMMYDGSCPELLEELADRITANGAQPRPYIVLETDENRSDRMLPTAVGHARFDAQWNDDVHHAFHVLLAGETDGYYADYAERPAARLARALAQGFAYQGDPSPFRGGAPRGQSSTMLPPSAFVTFLQNHDQIGNRAFGERITALAAPERVRAAVAVLLLAPAIPMLFMGEEWGASSPFLFFCDFEPELAGLVREGRRREFEHFSAFADEAARERIPDPGDSATFTRSKLRWSEREEPAHQAVLAFYRNLLVLRAREIAPRLVGLKHAAGTVLAVEERALSVRWKLADASALSLRANFSDVPCALPMAEGELLFATFPSDVSQAQLSPWSVTWQLLR